MLKNFKRSDAAGATDSVLQFRLKVLAGALALLNCIALALYFFPPGGTRDELTQESAQLHNRILAASLDATRMKNTSSKVQTGSGQAANFETAYFLPKRNAYVKVIEEIQRLAKQTGMQERDGVFSEEPIEGTADLSLLNITGNYEGPYGSLMRFLNEVDRSPMLLMLDALQAAPQQKDGQINASIRFQAIIADRTVVEGKQ